MRSALFQITRDHGSLTSWFAWLLPKSVVYHCGIRILARASCRQYAHEEVPSITAADALQRWHEIEVQGKWPGPPSKDGTMVREPGLYAKQETTFREIPQ